MASDMRSRGFSDPLVSGCLSGPAPYGVKRVMVCMKIMVCIRIL
jgi:hypothetical protein